MSKPRSNRTNSTPIRLFKAKDREPILSGERKAAIQGIGQSIPVEGDIIELRVIERRPGETKNSQAVISLAKITRSRLAAVTGRQILLSDLENGWDEDKAEAAPPDKTARMIGHASFKDFKTHLRKSDKGVPFYGLLFEWELMGEGNHG